MDVHWLSENIVSYPEPLSSSVARSRARSPLPDSVDVAIIGAGPGGLTAAGYLSRLGLRTAVFDSHYVAGGCATQFARGPKSQRYHFDIGLHYVGDCTQDGLIPRMLADIGVNVDFLEMDPDGFDTFVFPDFRFRVPADLDLYRQRLVSLFPSERAGIDRYVKFVQQVDRIGRSMANRGGRLSAAVALEVLLFGRLLARYQNATLGALLDTVTQNPQLRAVIAGQNGDYGLPPSRVSAVLHAGLAAHYFRGAYYPRGGGQILADSIAAAVEQRGGSIHLRRGISHILVENGRAVGVRTEPRDGESSEIRAKVVLSNADLKRTLLELIPPGVLPTEVLHNAQKYEMAAAIFLTCLGVKADLRAMGMQVTNYWQFDTYDMESLYREANQKTSPEVGACYITSATMKDPANPHHAPEGIYNVEVMTLVPGNPRLWGVEPGHASAWDYKRDDDYVSRKLAVENQMIDRLDNLFPGTKDHVVFRESATPVTHSRFTRATDGTGYGLAAIPSQFMKNRPGYRGPIQGLYFCGASTRAGHGIVGAMMSGKHAAAKIAADLGIASLKSL